MLLNKVESKKINKKTERIIKTFAQLIAEDLLSKQPWKNKFNRTDEKSNWAFNQRKLARKSE